MNSNDIMDTRLNLPWARWSILLIAGFTLARLIAVIFNPVTLHADETQYWIWSQNFDWGYYSKPPMIAWLIGLSTSIFGDGDFAVRLPAPLLHAGTASFLFLVARRLWDDKVGFITCLAYLTLPAVWVSSAIMSTDALLLCAWSGGLWALLRLRDGENWPSAVGLGLAIGLGFLSKYAMIYFIVGTGLALVFDPSTRIALFTRNGLIAACLAGLLILPNILWNAAHDFATVSHTAANANWGGDLFHPEEMAEFMIGQIGVFGPVFIFILLICMTLVFRQFKTISTNNIVLLGFSLPPLLIVSLQAFISRAHANWAVAAYLAGLLLVVSFLMRGPVWRRAALYGAIVLHSVVIGSLMVIMTSPSMVESIGASNSTKRIRGWHETAEAITEAGMADDYSAIVFDDRNVFHQMQRYAPGLDRNLAMWIRFSGPSNHAEQVWPLAEAHEGEILIVSHRPLEIARMREDFVTFEHVSDITISLDGSKTRDFTLWRAQGHTRVLRNDAYEERWLAVDAEAIAGE